MAHLIDLSNHRENMAYIGQTPWHGLGTRLNPDSPLEQWQVAAGLNFTYETTPVEFLGRTYEDRRVVYRSDTHAPLSVVSQRYQAVQPKEVIEFFRDQIEGYGFTMETAGALKEGAVVWALAKTGRAFNLGADESRQYLLLMTSCDSSLATRASLTSVRVVCWNTLSAAINNHSANLVVTRHNTKFDANATKRNLGLVDGTWTAFADVAEQMARKRLSDLHVKEAIISIFGDPSAAVEKQPNQRAMNRVLALYQGEGRGSKLPSSRNSAWGLLNAVTEFTDHHAPQRNEGSRLLSAWAGRGEVIKRKALETCIALAA